MADQGTQYSCTCRPISLSDVRMFTRFFRSLMYGLRTITKQTQTTIRVMCSPISITMPSLTGGRLQIDGPYPRWHLARSAYRQHDLKQIQIFKERLYISVIALHL